MTHDVTLADLATEMKNLQQQLQHVNQRLDSIYGAVTRLADAPAPAPQPKPAPVTDLPLSASMMMDPGSMLNSLRQHAQNAGLTISPAVVDRLQANLPENS